MVLDINSCVLSYMKYWPWDTTWGKLLSMQLQKYIDWEFPPDANSRVHDCDTINMLSIQSYIPLCRLIYERLKHPCDNISMGMIQGQIPLHHLTLREGSIYNHWLVNYAIPLTRIMTGMTWNIHWWGVYLDMKRLSIQFQSHCWH